jgi:hypothetical protein
MGYIKGLCYCGNKQESKGRINGRQVFGRYCTGCRKEVSKNKLFLKKDLACTLCGFKAQHKCQLDIDHIDGNHLNNEDSNLQVLCANCHRLKTYKNEDWKSCQTN